VREFSEGGMSRGNMYGEMCPVYAAPRALLSSRHKKEGLYAMALSVCLSVRSSVDYNAYCCWRRGLIASTILTAMTAMTTERTTDRQMDGRTDVGDQSIPGPTQASNNIVGVPYVRMVTGTNSSWRHLPRR